MRNRWVEDAGERMHLYHAAAWAFAACTIFAIMVAYALLTRHQIGAAGALGILLLGWLLAAAITFLAWRAAGLFGRGLIHTLTASGNLAPAPSFSLQEALIARGRFAEAELRFREHLATRPDDLDARLALAALWRDHLHDAGTAERLLLEIRRMNPPAQIEYAVSNALIDLYHAGGRQQRELAELARFAERFAGSAAGDAARAALGARKARARASPPPPPAAPG